MDEQPFSSTIYENLKQKSTSELAAIWRENDRTAWADETFENIERILKERNVALPEVGEGEQDEAYEMDEGEEPDTYHDPEKILQIAGWMRTLGIALASFWFVIALIDLASRAGTLLSLEGVYYIGTLLLNGMGSLAVALMLLGASQLMLLFMDIEANTRKVPGEQDAE